MVASWFGKGDVQRTPTISDIPAATMRLSLYVISYAGFGVKLLWPHEETEEKELPEGHKMGYKEALSTLLENILVVMLLPRWFLSRSPFKATKVAYNAYLEWGKYMREMFEAKKAEVMAGESRDGMDLMGMQKSLLGYKSVC